MLFPEIEWTRVRMGALEATLLTPGEGIRSVALKSVDGRVVIDDPYLEEVPLGRDITSRPTDNWSVERRPDGLKFDWGFCGIPGRLVLIPQARGINRVIRLGPGWWRYAADLGSFGWAMVLPEYLFDRLWQHLETPLAKVPEGEDNNGWWVPPEEYYFVPAIVGTEARWPRNYRTAIGKKAAAIAAALDPSFGERLRRSGIEWPEIRSLVFENPGWKAKVVFRPEMPGLELIINLRIGTGELTAVTFAGRTEHPRVDGLQARMTIRPRPWIPMAGEPILELWFGGHREVGYWEGTLP